MKAAAATAATMMIAAPLTKYTSIGAASGGGTVVGDGEAVGISDAVGEVSVGDGIGVCVLGAVGEGVAGAI